MLNIILLSIGLVVDTTLASFTQGSFASQKHIKDALKISTSFALFQGLMPILGWIIAQYFYEVVKEFDHWLAFFLFIYLGGKLIFDSFKKKDNRNHFLNYSKILLLSLATSIDSLLAGVTLSFMNENIYITSLMIGILTFIFSLIGFWLGHRFKKFDQFPIELVGGALLILLGFKVLLEHIYFTS